MNVRPAPTRARTSFVAVSLVLAFASPTACVRHRPVARPYPAPSVAELEAALSARQRAVTSMNARVRATSWLGGDRVRATVLMLVDRRGHLRFEAEVSLQGTVAILATDGQRFEFFDVQQNEIRRGPACPANVASLIRIPLASTDIAAILLGDVARPTSPAAPSIRGPYVDWDADQGADVLALPRHDGWLRLLWKLPRTGSRRLVGAIATDSDGRARWRVAFEDFSDTPVTATTVAMPSVVRFAEGQNSFDEGVEIKVKDRTLNAPEPPASFSVSAPAGTPTVEVGCGGYSTITPGQP